MEFNILSLLGLSVGGFVNSYVMQNYGNISVATKDNFFAFQPMFNAALVGVAAYTFATAAFNVLSGKPLFARSAIYDYFEANGAKFTHATGEKNPTRENANGVMGLFFNADKSPGYSGPSITTLGDIFVGGVVNGLAYYTLIYFIPSAANNTFGKAIIGALSFAALALLNMLFGTL